MNRKNKSSRNISAGSGLNVNSLDVIGNAALHRAIIVGSLERLNCLLQQPNVQLNIKNIHDETPLLLSIKLKRASPIVLRLIEAGADVNMPNRAKEAPLHMAILHPSTRIAHELLKREADVNAQDQATFTPLHIAVGCRNLELINMLLYYRADVNLCCRNGMTPLMYALSGGMLNVSEVLIDFYCEFSSTNTDNYNALHFALVTKSPLAARIVKASNDANYAADAVLTRACLYESAELFKLMWPKLQRKVKCTFLLEYLRHCHFSTSEWLECLHLILESPVASDLITRYKTRRAINYALSEDSLFYQLLHNLKYRNIECFDRMAIILSCLYLGAEVALSDLNIAYKLYGFNEEVEFLLYCYHSCEEVNFRSAKDNLNFLLPTCLIARDFDYNSRLILRLLQNQIAYDEQQMLSLGLEYLDDTHTSGSSMVFLLRFFSLSYQVRQKLACLCLDYSNFAEIFMKLVQVPEVPSLLELSRNNAHKYIKRAFNVKYAYQFVDAVRSLNLPPRVKALLLFVVPPYA